MLSRFLAHDALFEGLEDDEEDGDDEQQGNGADDHTANGADAKGVVAVGSNACGKGQWQESEDHGERRHKDRTQADGSGIEGCIDDAHALTTARRGILGEQDGCLRQQTDEHDETRLHVDIVLESPQPRKEEGACQSEGYAKNDGQGDEEALVEGAEDEVDEDDADDEDQRGGVLRGCLLAGHAAKFIAVAFAQHLGSDLADGVDGLSTTIAVGSGSTHLNGWEEVEARQRLRAIDTRQREILADG